MVKKRGANESLATTDEVVISSENIAESIENEEEDTEYAHLLLAAQEIRNEEGVIGFILRGVSKATADLDDSAKIVEYALLSSQTFESSEKVAESFNLGKINKIVIEGKSFKAVCINQCKNRLCMFMRINTAHEHLLNAFGKYENST
jgi:hypothetical protein